MKVWGVRLILLVVIITGCSKCGDENTGKKISQREIINNRVRIEIKNQLSNFSEEDLKKLKSGKELSEFYSKNHYKTFWIEDKGPSVLSDSLFKEICLVNNHGLNISDYNILPIKNLLEHFKKHPLDTSNIKEAARLEILLTDAFFTLSTQLSEGRIHYKKLKPEWKGADCKENLFTAIHEINKSKTFNKVFSTFLPKNINYNRLASAYSIYRNKTDSIIKEMEQVSKDSLGEKRYMDLRTHLLGYLQIKDSLNRSVSTLNIKKDLVGLKKASKFRNQQIEVNLERYRIKRKLNYPDTSIIINIPAYELRFYENRNEVLFSKVIVGDPETPTPTLNSKVKHYFIYPTWNVPYSIASKEILPEVQKDTSYLGSMKMQVLDKEGNLIDPSTIDWSILSAESLAYKFRQTEGHHNSLGIIKFIFNNKHGVYLHDTNAKNLFEKENRALSHGCVRVQKAFELAVLLTKYADYAYDQEKIEKYINTKKKKFISLKQEVPIFLDYFTCTVSPDVNINFHEDIYSLDNKMINALYK